MYYVVVLYNVSCIIQITIGKFAKEKGDKMKEKIKRTETAAELLKFYDTLIGITFANVYGQTVNAPDIYIKNFDTKDKKHLYILDICIKVNSIYYANKKKIKLQTNIFSYILFKIKKIIRKSNLSKYSFARKKDLFDKNSIDPNELCDYMAAAHGKTAEIFKDIFEEYYE